jgi:hypothetical protein
MNAKVDCDALFKVVMPMARPLVDQFGEFYPFAMTMDRHGVISGLSAAPSSGDEPSIAAVWGTLRDSLRDLAESGNLRAGAICVNTAITIGDAKRDAITVFVEHEDGLALEVVVPYQRAGAGRVAYDAPIARESGPRGPEIFAHVRH